MLNLRSLTAALALAALLTPAAFAASSAKTFTVTNSGSGPLTITGAAISGNPSEYTLTPGGCATPVPVGGSCSFTVTFTPTGVGARTPATLNFSSNGTNGPTHSISLAGAGGAACTAGKVAYSYTGADQFITVPAGCTTATIKAWGAGGGSSAFSGGAGGFSQRTVTGLQPSVQLLIIVGGGGVTASSSPVPGGYGGGGTGHGTGLYKSGTGGGLSGVFLGAASQASAIAVAGGGGGGYSAAGGAGGGAAGVAGSSYLGNIGGGGGTQTAGGAIGNQGNASPGGPLQGGNGTAIYSSGGGGGYWGGGGAGYAPGGGGSGYAPGGGSLIAGSGCTVANSADGDYISGIGNGGCSANTPGQNGLVVIQWSQ